jgi:hypothetical protein
VCGWRGDGSNPSEPLFRCEEPLCAHSLESGQLFEIFCVVPDVFFLIDEETGSESGGPSSRSHSSSVEKP